MKDKKHVREVDLLPPIALTNQICPIQETLDWKEERGLLVKLFNIGKS